MLGRVRVRGFGRLANRLGFAAAGLWLAAASGAALNPSTPIAQYGRDVWDSDSGLPQNSVDAILQTRDGYLWLGTQEGLVRFDGVRFTIFDTRNSHAMHDDWVKALCETRDGTLWIGTEAGLLRWKNGGFEVTQPRGALSTAVELRAALAGRTLRTLSEMEGSLSRKPDRAAVRDAYALALGLVEYLMQARGPGAVSCLVRGLGEGAPLEQALRAETGFTETELLAAWKGWAGLPPR